MEDGVVKREPLDLKRFQEVGKASILAWLNVMEAYLAVSNSLANAWVAMAKSYLESRVFQIEKEIITKLYFQPH